MKDRIPTYPGRVKLLPVAGQANIYDMTMADEPTQEGDAPVKANLLTDETASLYSGLPENPVPDDVFAVLGLGDGNYGYSITILYPDLSPAAGLKVNGVTDKFGEQISTDKNGKFFAVSSEQSISFSISSPYFDLNSISKSIQSTGLITAETVFFEERPMNDDGYELITTSGTIEFYNEVTCDFTAVGGGGGGGGNFSNSSARAGGGGGGGGYVSHLLGKKIEKGSKLQITVGSGGGVGSSGTPSRLPGTGGTGGETKITLTDSDGTNDILSAMGGYGGGFASAYRGVAAGGVGNGNGGAGGTDGYVSGYNGGSSTIRIFDESNLPLAGGGGGGGGIAAASSMSASGNIYSTGGSPNGANGSWENQSGYYGTNASLAGVPGGGGGGQSCESTRGYGSQGGKGGVYIRWSKQ